MAPIVLALKERKADFDCRVIVTAQHRGMLDQVLSLFGIQPDYDLDIMTEGQTLTQVTVKALSRLERVLTDASPDIVLVHGDTTTALCASLAAFYQQLPVGHVEAGLRSHDLLNPFPEELNRRVADSICCLHFAPTPAAARNLIRERVNKRGIHVTGNTGIDALKMCAARLGSGAVRLPPRDIVALANGRFVLMTAHRRENFGLPLENVCLAVRDVAREQPEVNFVYPVHPNPNVTQTVFRLLANLPNVHLVGPLDYSDFVFLLKQCEFVVTDSGGLQEEAPSMGKAVLVLRKVTERPEAVRAGTARVIGTESIAVRRWISRLLNDKDMLKRMGCARNPYGDGRAAFRTVEAIRYWAGMRSSRPNDFRE
jgi:UDP-N-acetylglucosamine 2-epimerase (non-hydrolysing)